MGMRIFGARKAPRQSVDRHLGGEGAEKYGAGHRGLGIGVLEPVVKQGEGALDGEGGEDQGRPGIAGSRSSQMVEGQGAADPVMDEDSGQQDEAGADLDDQIAHARGVSAPGAPAPDQQYRGNRGHFPGHEEGDQVAGKDGGDGGSGVDEAGPVLYAVAQMEGVDRAEDGHYVEDVAENQAELVDADAGEGVVEELDAPIGAGGKLQQVDEAEQRQGHHAGALQAPAQQGEEEGSQDHDGGRGQLSHRSSPPRALPPGARSGRQRR